MTKTLNLNICYSYDVNNVPTTYFIVYIMANSNILNLLNYGCKARSIPNNWLIRGLIQTVWSHCSGRCLNKFQFHPKCTICKDVIKDIKNKIKVSPIEQEITFRLESLCDPLPDKDKCVDFVERNTEKFLNTLIDDISEESICKEIGYC